MVRDGEGNERMLPKGYDSCMIEERIRGEMGLGMEKFIRGRD